MKYLREAVTRDIQDTHLGASTLPLYAVPTAREAKLVMRYAGTLHEMRVLQTFLA